MDKMFSGHVDLEKLEKFPDGQPFEYIDVISNDLYFKKEAFVSEDKFKDEVLKGVYSGVYMVEDNGPRSVYKKNR